MIAPAMVVTAAALLFQQFPILPPATWLLATVPLGLIALRHPRFRLLGCFLLAFAWTHGWSLLNEPPVLDEAMWGRDLLLTGQVSGLPTLSGDTRRFMFDVDNLVDAVTGEVHSGNWRFRIAWYRSAPPLQSGERWQLQARLKPARSYRNPGSFDYQGWLYRQRVRYTGYVRDSTENRRLAPSSGWSLNRWRQQLSQRVGSAPVSPQAAGLLRALTVGDRSGIAPQQWRVLRHTGTNHLVAISGLHVGLVAGLLMWLTGHLWRRFPLLCRRLPAQQAAAWAGLLGAFGYATLAGFSLPTQRALLMLLVLLGAVLLRRPLRSGHGLALALLAVLLFDPAAVLSAGFWLSFIAVAAILLVIKGGHEGGARLGQWLRLQGAVALGLAPLLLFFFQQIPLLAPLVNLLAIPFFSFLVVPLALLGVLLLPLPMLAGPLLRGAGWLLDQASEVLRAVADWDGVVLALPQAPSWALILALPGVLLLLLPRGVPGRYLGMVLPLPLLLAAGERPVAGDFHFTLLDVGQGTAAVIRTRGHVLVYDTGPGYPSGFNAGTAVVAPYLRQQGLEVIDLLVLSHGDKDHAGGARGLLSELPARRIISGEPGRLRGIAAAPCRLGQAWDWDGVKFEVLHPPTGSLLSGNDASCVLRVSNPAGSLLLTGDIEAKAEQRLLPLLDEVGVDVLTVPHHGSLTSSSGGFVAAAQADEVLVSAGWRNRYGFPRPEVIGRWREAGAHDWNTAAAGALSYVFGADGRRTGPRAYTRQSARYWQLPSSGSRQN